VPSDEGSGAPSPGPALRPERRGAGGGELRRSAGKTLEIGALFRS
jgi:hypothetical protein